MTLSHLWGEEARFGSTASCADERLIAKRSGRGAERGARRAGEGKSGRAPICLELALVYSEGRTLSPGPRSAPQPFAELRALKRAKRCFAFPLSPRKRERGAGPVARMQSGKLQSHLSPDSIRAT